MNSLRKGLTTVFLFNLDDITAVVSTIVFSFHFSCLHTVEPISKKTASISDVIVVQKRFQLRSKVHFLWVGLLMTSQRKPYMVGIYSTVQKRAKRTPDTIVATTTADFVSHQLETFISKNLQISFVLKICLYVLPSIMSPFEKDNIPGLSDK